MPPSCQHKRNKWKGRTVEKEMSRERERQRVRGYSTDLLIECVLLVQLTVILSVVKEKSSPVIGAFPQSMFISAVKPYVRVEVCVEEIN